MLLSKFDNIKIAGLAVALPTMEVPVTGYNDRFGEEAVAKFIETTGVKSVRRATKEQTASDLGYEAARLVLEKTGIPAEEIGLLVFVTQKPDYRIPSTAFILQKRLNLTENCTCFDLNLACSGYIYAMQTAFSMLKNSDSKYALVLTGDTSVRTISPEDRTMIMLFGDSGTATLLEKDAAAKPAYFTARTDGRRFKSIITPAGMYRNRFLPKERTVWGDDIVRSDYDTHMKGMDVFGFSITDVPKLLKEFMAELETTVDNYDYFTLHQANLYIINQIARKLKIPAEKIPVSLDRFGNNSSNSIPLVLADHFGNTGSGEIRCMSSGFGAGLSWACADLSVNTGVIFPLLFTDRSYSQ